MGGYKFQNRLHQDTKLAGPQDASTKRTLELGWWLVALVAIATVIVIRVRLLGTPLERDEGEYAYAGQLLLQGIPPYKLVYSMKFPGTGMAYAVMMAIFGQTAIAIHLGLLVINVVTCVLVFLLGRQLFGLTAGRVGSASYAVLSLGIPVLGLACHATHFVMLFAVAGLLVLTSQLDRKTHIFASGTLFGMALLMKQPGALFVFFGASYLLCNDICRGRNMKETFLRAMVFITAAILPLGITCLVLWHAGVFDRFWFWTIDYAREYGGEVTLSRGIGLFVQNSWRVIGSAWELWLLAAYGLIIGLYQRATRTSTGVVAGFLFFSLLAMCVGLFFREHYFILILPAVSLLVGVALSQLREQVTKCSALIQPLPMIIVFAVLMLPVWQERDLFFRLTPTAVVQTIYPRNPFVESTKIAEFVRDHTNPDDRIAVFGSEPQIYFYARRHSATGYVYTYGMTEDQKYALRMQREMIHEVGLTRPKYVILVVIDLSWSWRQESPKVISSWITEYTNRDYSLVGLVNMIGFGRTDYYWEEHVPPSVRELGSYVLIYERKS